MVWDLANLLSLIPAGLLVFVGFQAVFYHIEYFIVFVIAILLNASVELIKAHSKPYIHTYSWLQRPVGACDCNSLNMGGSVGTKPGFPSGHVTMTTFLLTCIFALSLQQRQRIALLPLYTILILAVAWARVEKRCHYVVQTIAGAVYGLVVAIILLLNIQPK